MISQEITKAVISLKRYRGILTTQQLRTLKGQMLSGDLEGAQKGLSTLLAKVVKSEGGSNNVNRQQRRKLERDAAKVKDNPKIVNPDLSFNTKLPQSVLEEFARHYENGKKAGWYEGWHAGCGYAMKVGYAAAVLVMSEKEGYRNKRNTDMLRRMDHHVLYTLSSDEIIEEAFKKGGVLIDFREPFTDDRIREAPKE